MNTPFALIDGPADYDFCEQSSRCTWNNQKPVSWCSLHEHAEVCKNLDPNYQLKGCYPDKETCLYHLNPQKFSKPSSVKTTCKENDPACVAKKVSAQKPRVSYCSIM